MDPRLAKELRPLLLAWCVAALAAAGYLVALTHPIFAKSSLIIAILGMSLMSRCLGQAVYTPYNFIYLAGTGYIGTNDGPGWGATFYLPLAGALDTVGNLYVAEGGTGGSNSTIGQCDQVPAVGPYTGGTTGSRISKVSPAGVRSWS